jgi:hypothetical protein
MWSVIFLAGCNGDKDSGELEPNILLQDENNYEFDGEITIDNIDVAPESELTFDWSALTQDIQCHEVDPTQMVTAALMRFQNLTQPEVANKINTNSLVQADLTNYIDYSIIQPDTDVFLSELNFFGTAVDALEFMTPDAGTFLTVITDSEQKGVGVKSLTFVSPVEGETNTIVTYPDPCGLLDYTVELESLTKVANPGEEEYIIGWEPLTVDATGILLDDAEIDEVMVGWYETETVAELEAQFLDIELLAEKLWTMPVNNVTVADLSGLQGDEAFTGFSSEGVWLLALTCTTCPNPAPKFLTFIE